MSVKSIAVSIFHGIGALHFLDDFISGEKIQVIPNHTSAATSGLFGSPISLLGSRCYPVSVLSIGGKNCADQLVCCEGKEFVS